MNELPMASDEESVRFDTYESKFKALADAKRLRILHLLVQHGKVCVCDLVDMVNMPQSKLSYHLKILLDQNLIEVETHGKWNYYSMNRAEVDHLLSEEIKAILQLKAGCE